MQGAYLGPHYSNSEVQRYLDTAGAKYVTLTDDDLFPKVARILADDKVVGWFQGRAVSGFTTITLLLARS